MKEVFIDLGQRSYKIVIGQGLMDRVGPLVAGLRTGRKVLMVTNPTVANLYASQVEESLAREGFDIVRAEVPDGEQYKTLQSAEMLYDRAFSAGLDRNCPVVALGGGVVGDLTGFVAATYMRGVPFVQIPTTLLAQVDSSVGGKVAVNHPKGKNIIGAFYQPAIVISDTDTLRTLDTREVRSGLAEVIKYGIIKDADFYAWLEQNIHGVLALEPAAMAYIIEQSCINKARVVEQDETEQGQRAILNLGHTVGHAIEALAGYGRYSHGEAVSIGTAVAARMAVNMGLLNEAEESRIIRLLKMSGLPLGIPGDIATTDIIDSIYGDKKTQDGEITFILPQRIGKAIIRKNMPTKMIDIAIDSLRDV